MGIWRLVSFCWLSNHPVPERFRDLRWGERLADAVHEDGDTVILPKDRDSRFITIRRGGTLTDSDPSAPGFVGCCVRGARSTLLRVGAALGPAAPRGDRADSGMGVRRDQDVSAPSGGWPCHGCGKSVERSRSARRICCRPGGSGGTCRRTRAWCCGLRDQGCACGGPRTGG